MENQHRKIKGYRELSKEEIELMNLVKEKGSELGQLLDKVSELEVSPDSIECLGYARKDLKQGIMWLVRAVAQPQTF